MVVKMNQYTVIFDNGSFVIIDAYSAIDAYSEAIDQSKTNNWKKEDGSKLNVAVVILGDITDKMVVYGVGHV